MLGGTIVSGDGLYNVICVLMEVIFVYCYCSPVPDVGGDGCL